MYEVDGIFVTVIGDRIYRLREKNGNLWGCPRCQDGDHSSCHGCSCPCNDYDHFNPEATEAAQTAIERTSWMPRDEERDKKFLAILSQYEAETAARWRAKTTENINAAIEAFVEVIGDVTCIGCGKGTDIRDTFYLMGVPYCPTCTIEVAKKR